MKAKSRRQKLANSPYLTQDHLLQPDGSSSIAFYKKNKLDKSIYSPQQTHIIIDYQAENIQLKQTIQTISQQHRLKQAHFNTQIQAMKVLLKQKQSLIQQLQKNISQLQQQVHNKNSSLMDKITQCEQIVKQLEDQQLKTSTHNMLQTSRISKFNLEQTNTILIHTTQTHPSNPLHLDTSFISPENPTAHNLTQQNVFPRSGQSQDIPQNQYNPTTVKYQHTTYKNMFHEDKRGDVQRSVPKRGQSPGVVFNYRPQKVVAPFTPVYNAQRNILQVNTTLNYSKSQLSQHLPLHNRSVISPSHNGSVISPSHNGLVNNGYKQSQVNTEYPNPIRRALSPQSIQMGNPLVVPGHYSHANNLVKQK